jgi:tRNA modification GTPase
VRETIEIGGLPVTFADTAGLRPSEDLVEGIGVERAREAAWQADLILYLVDAARGEDDDDREERSRFRDKELIVIYTKRDLAKPPAGTLSISAATGEGMESLLRRLDEVVRNHFAVPEEAPALVNERQRAAVAEAESALGASIDSIDAEAEEQFIVVDLYRAANALGALTGAVTRDDILREIFARFCIGK